MGSYMLILIRKAGRIGKYGIGTAKLLSPGIHCCYKGIYRSAYMFSHLKGNIVGRCYHNGIETLLHGKNLIQLRRDICTAVCNSGYTGGCHGNLVIQTAVFQDKQAGHDLDCTGRIKCLVCIF